MLLPLRHRHEDLAAIAPHEQEYRLTGRDPLQFAGDLRDAGHRLPIDLEDHIVRRQTGVRGRAVAFDPGDHRATLTARQLELLRTLRRHRVDFHAEPGRGRRAARLLARRLAALLGGEIELVDGDVQRLALFVAVDRDRHAGAWLGVHHHRDQRVAVLDRTAVELDDHVARLEAGLRRRATRADRAEERAVVIGKTEALGNRAGQRVDADFDANHAAGDLAGAQLWEQIPNGVDRGGEPD